MPERIGVTVTGKIKVTALVGRSRLSLIHVVVTR